MNIYQSKHFQFKTKHAKCTLKSRDIGEQNIVRCVQLNNIIHEVEYLYISCRQSVL